MFSRPCIACHRGVVHSSTPPFPHASARTSRSLAIVAGAFAALAIGGTAHGALKSPGSTALVAGSIMASPSIATLEVADVVMGEDLIARASRLAPAMEFDAPALLLGNSGGASPCLDLTDRTRTPGLGAWNCDERVHFRANAAIRSSIDETVRSIASIALR